MADYYQGHDEAAQTAEETTANQIIECPPSVMDCTNSYFPSTSEMQNVSNLEFGLICQPLHESEHEEIPLINFSVHAGGDTEAGSVIRCRSCRSYINPFIEWISDGMHNHWVCNLCGVSNEMRSKLYIENYYNGLCKELQYASVEIVAPDEYCVRTPQFPAYLFVINVSQQLIQSNILHRISHTIKQLLRDTDNEHNFNAEHQQQTQVGFITYSDKIHFYSLKPNLSKPKMIVVNDLNDALLPIPPNQIMTNLSDSRELIEGLLNMLPSLHSSSSAPPSESVPSENSLGTALAGASSALKEIGGRIMCFSSGLPSLGKGKVMDRSLNINPNNHTEYDKLLKRASNYYMDLAIAMTKYQISCDLFQFSSALNEFCDMSTLKSVCRCSGGQLYFYQNYNDVLHGDSFSNDLYKSLTRAQAWESVMRIRCSKGVSIKNYYGCFYRRSADLLSIPTMDCDKSVTVSLSHTNIRGVDDADDESKKDGNAKGSFINGPFIYVQSALLYTNSFGQRRIRCCTKRIPVTSSYEDLFYGVNLPAMTAFIAKQAVFKILSKDVASARMFIQDSCIAALQSYCKQCNVFNGLKSESEYPEAIRFWPLYTLGLLKSCAFADIRDVSKWLNIDQRVSVLTNLLHLNSAHIEMLVRPSLYRIDDIVSLDDETLNDEYYLPTESPLSSSSLSPDGIYLLDNGQTFLIRIGRKADANTVSTLFERQRTFLSLKSDMNHNKYVYKLYSIVQYLQSINYRHQSVDIFSETQKEKDAYFSVVYLVRDRTDSVMAYDEFLQFIHRSTKPKISPTGTQRRR